MSLVTLHVYDLSNGMAAQFSRQLIGKHIEGVWHTGIVAFNKEYYFGGGISYDPPSCTPFGRPTKSIELGFTEIPEDLFMEFLREVSPRFTQATYNVFKHNCNNFTNECANFLLGQGIPSDIINLPNEFLNTPLGRMVGPMLQQAQDNLKVQSHPLFNQTGAQVPLAGGLQGGSQSMQDPGAQMNQFVNAFANAGLGQSQPKPQQAAGSSGGHGAEVIQVQNLQHLQKLIKESPAIAVDFWSPTCQPCMRIKPTFEALAKSNENENLKFAAVNTSDRQDCAQAFRVTGIPQFYFFHQGKEFNKFTGADVGKLNSVIAELNELVKSNVGNHKQMTFQQFKPMNLAPQGFTAIGQIDKMKEFITAFASSAEAKKDCKSTDKVLQWLQNFKLEFVAREVIDELMDLISCAEDRNKIALIDLLRLLLVHEPNAAHILNKHWGSIEDNIFGYITCFDMKDSESKVQQNYHMVCLKMLCNIYQTDSGKDFMQGEEAAKAIVNFCTFSFDSINPKVVFHAAITLFNQILVFKRDKSLLNSEILDALKKINTVVADTTLVDQEAHLALLMCECRLLYCNQKVCEAVQEKLLKDIEKNHQALKTRSQAKSVKEGVNDVLVMISIE